MSSSIWRRSSAGASTNAAGESLFALIARANQDPAVIALADTCAAIGCGNNIPAGSSFTTIELKSNFLSSARVGERVVCRCTPVHVGRQTHVWDATVSNETTGRVMALFRCTQMVLPPR